MGMRLMEQGVHGNETNGAMDRMGMRLMEQWIEWE